MAGIAQQDLSINLVHKIAWAIKSLYSKCFLYRQLMNIVTFFNLFFFKTTIKR